MFPTVAEHHGWRIERRAPGFEFTPGLLGKISTYIAVAADGRLGVFAFMYSFLITDGPAGNEDELASTALDVVKRAIESGTAIARLEHTYELSQSGWSEVDRPRWWVSLAR